PKPDQRLASRSRMPHPGVRDAGRSRGPADASGRDTQRMRRNRPQPAMSDLPPRIARKIRLAREKRSTALDLSRDFWSETGERLTEIPPEVLELDALEVLTLSDNHISEIPGA